MKYDFIIVGGGSAGSILAARLSESGRHHVLLIEAGGWDDSLWFKLPVGYIKSYYNPKQNWMYRTAAQAELGERELYVPRGKVVGGSGSINAMIYVRGQAKDFDDWAAAGNRGWDYADVLPYFKRLEAHPKGETAYRGGSGPIGITPLKPHAHPICKNYLEACKELGLTYTDDFNSEQFEGAGIYEANIAQGKRASSSFAYLHPARQRNNLTIMTDTHVQRLVIDAQRRVTGVVCIRDGAQYTLTAAKEIILSAGAVDSPKLLQLSGIGPGPLLAQHGIKTIVDLPGVGQNLQDHLCASFYYRANRKTLNDELGSFFGKAKAALQYALFRNGPLSLSVNQGGGFFRGRETLSHPNLQIYFNPLSYTLPKDPGAGLRPDPYSGFLIAFNPCRPTSQGSIEIASADASVAPRIAPNYLSTPHDRAEVLQGCELVRRLMSAPALQAITEEEVSPGKHIQSENDFMRFFEEQSGSIYHLCGTCAMGPDSTRAVVSDTLEVYGVSNLRIVDASVFPNITSGNINAPVMMVAEKAADMILAAHAA